MDASYIWCNSRYGSAHLGRNQAAAMSRRIQGGHRLGQPCHRLAITVTQGAACLTSVSKLGGRGDPSAARTADGAGAERAVSRATRGGGGVGSATPHGGSCAVLLQPLRKPIVPSPARVVDGVLRPLWPMRSEQEQERGERMGGGD